MLKNGLTPTWMVTSKRSSSLSQTRECLSRVGRCPHPDLVVECFDLFVRSCPPCGTDSDQTCSRVFASHTYTSPSCQYAPVIVDLVSSFSLISSHPLDECVLSPSLVHFTSYPIGRTVIAIAVLSNTDMGRSNHMHSTWVTMVFKFMIGLLDFYATRNFVQNDLNNRRLVRLLRVHLDGIPIKQAGMDRRCTCAPFMCIKIRILTPIHRHPYLLRFSRTGYQSSLRKVAKPNL